MKKWLLIFSFILLAATLYFLYSGRPAARQVVGIHSSITAANRCFLDTSAWAGWWPKAAGYRIEGVFYNEVRFLFGSGRRPDVPVRLRIAQVAQDSVIFGWEGDLSRKDQVEMDSVLGAFRAYVLDNRNIYGVPFHRTMSNDSTLVTITRVEEGYPATDYIYARIDSLREYARANGARVINYPMLNVSQVEGGQYRVMIALSLDKTLPGNERIAIKRFVPWKMIEGEVRGGVSDVRRAMRQLYHFRDDNRLSIMALPFESLVTDRRQERDSTQWITKVCAPIS